MSVIEKSRDVDLQQVKVASPASALLRFRLGDALRMMVEHNKRNLKQADAIMAPSGFPPDLETQWLGFEPLPSQRRRGS
jgi:hypothetical protein